MEVVARVNYRRSGPRKARILACTINNLKKVAVSESREIARVACLGQITNIGSDRVQNYKRSTSGRARILICAMRYSKKVAVSESHKIARVAYLGQITIIGSGQARK